MKANDQDLDETQLHQLLEHARTKDTKSVARLCEIFYPKVYRYFYCRVNRTEDAEDLTNETCLKAVGALQKQAGSFPAWIFRIASNLLTDFYRRRSVRQSVESVGASIETILYTGGYNPGTCPLTDIYLINKAGEIFYATQYPGVSEKELTSQISKLMKGNQ